MLNIKQLSQSHAKTCPFCRDGFQPNKQLFACQECNALIHKECWSEHPSCMACQAMLITHVKLNKHGDHIISKARIGRKQRKRQSKKTKLIHAQTQPTIIPTTETRVGRERTQATASRIASFEESDHEVIMLVDTNDSPSIDIVILTGIVLLLGLACLGLSYISDWLTPLPPGEESALTFSLAFFRCTLFNTWNSPGSSECVYPPHAAHEKNCFLFQQTETPREQLLKTRLSK